MSTSMDLIKPLVTLVASVAMLLVALAVVAWQLSRGFGQTIRLVSSRREPQRRGGCPCHGGRQRTGGTARPGYLQPAQSAAA